MQQKNPTTRNFIQTVSVPQSCGPPRAQDHKRGEKRWNASEEAPRGTECRSPSPLACDRTRKDNVQGLRPFNQIKQESTAFPQNQKLTFFTPSSAFIKKATISSIPFSARVHSFDSILQIDLILITTLIHLSQRKFPTLSRVFLKRQADRAAWASCSGCA
jgi:hypothetical protein